MSRSLPGDFFFCGFLQTKTSTSATEAQTSCALLCVGVSDLSGFQQLAEDRDTEKSLSGSKSLAFLPTPYRVLFVSFSKYLFRAVCTWLTFALGSAELAESEEELKAAVEKVKLKGTEFCAVHFNLANWSLFCYNLVNDPGVQIREHRAREKKYISCTILWQDVWPKKLRNGTKMKQNLAKQLISWDKQ